MLRCALICLLLCLSVPAFARLGGPADGWRNSTRDLAEIRSSGVLRVLINQSRTSSGEVKGEVIGVEYQRLRSLEQQLNADKRNDKRIRVQLIPRPKEQLLDALRKGEGDMVAPGEVLGETRWKGVRATEAVRRAVPLVIVARQGNRRYRNLEDLSGRVLMLPAGSAVPAALDAANVRLKARHRAPIRYELVDPSLAVEDVLEMVNSGLYLLTAVEQPIAERWAKVMPKLRIDPHMVLDNTRSMHWFVRRDASMLQARLDRFLKHYRSPADRDVSFQRIYRRAYRVHDALGAVERKRLERVRPVLQKHAANTGLDWTLLAALAYKESTLNPTARGSGGATGLMQVTPATARSVGLSDVSSLDNNVRASVKYLSLLRSRHFSSKRLEERERLGFMLAAYNLGPQRVQSLRAEARRRGLDPDKWFFQVERVAMDQLGLGVASYVGAVNKYYLAYQRDQAPSRKHGLASN